MINESHSGEGEKPSLFYEKIMKNCEIFAFEKFKNRYKRYRKKVVTNIEGYRKEDYIMKNAFSNMSYGIYLLTTRYGDKDNGCIVSSVMQVGFDPNLIIVCLKKHNTTSCIINRTKVFNLSVLSEKTEYETIKNFGFQSGKDVDKFENYKAFKRAKNGLAYSTVEANAYISLEVENTFDIGDAVLFVSRVKDMEVLNDDKTLTYDFFLKNIKPEDEVRYKCRICGHEYVGEIPDNYVCPICGNKREVFQKL